MTIYLNKSGNNIFFWSISKQEGSYAKAVTEPTEAEVSAPGAFSTGSVVRNGNERLKIIEIIAL